MDLLFTKLNGVYTPKIRVVGILKRNTITIQVEGGTFRLTRFVAPVERIDLYSYGYMTDDLKRRPGHGGEWSSRPAVINDVFGKELASVDVVIDNKNNVHFGITMTDIKLPPNMKWKQKYAEEDTYGILCTDPDDINLPNHTLRDKDGKVDIYANIFV